MGSWSVCCGISNIAITSGNECCILPIKKSVDSETREWKPATLPIFGRYNDYGGIEDIVKDDNTEFIEKHFGVSIDDFCTFLVDGKFTYDRDEAKDVTKNIKNIEEIQDWRFMWIDKQVYDYMKIFNDKWYKGHNDYGTPKFMELFGFELVAETKLAFKNYDPKRFCKLYRNKDGVEFFSDGKTLLATGEKGSYVYSFGKGKDNSTSLEHFFDVPEKFQYLTQKSQAETWRLMERDEQIEHIGSIIAGRMAISNLRFDRMLGKNKNKEKTIDIKYLDSLEVFGDRLVELININNNLYPMSGCFEPHKLYLTPQCGEHERHQQILEKFAEINKSYCQNEDEE